MISFMVWYSYAFLFTSQMIFGSYFDSFSFHVMSYVLYIYRMSKVSLLHAEPSQYFDDLHQEASMPS
jgi:hypothetical protein